MPDYHLDPFSGLPFSSPDRPLTLGSIALILISIALLLFAVVLNTRPSGASQPPTPIDGPEPLSVTGVVFDSSTSSPLTGVRVELFSDTSSGDNSSGDTSSGDASSEAAPSGADPSGDATSGGAISEGVSSEGVSSGGVPSGSSSSDSACGCSAMADIPSRVTTTGANGLFRFAAVSPGAYVVKASAPGYQSTRTSIRIEPNPSGPASNPAPSKATRINLYLSPDDSPSADSGASGESPSDGSSKAEAQISTDLSSSVQAPRGRTFAPGRAATQLRSQGATSQGPPSHKRPPHPGPPHNTESYDRIEDNPFYSPLDEPLSTFSIDVDAASYANIRRFLLDGELPPKDAVRIEEMLNYFDYDYPQGPDRSSSEAEVSGGESSPDGDQSLDGDQSPGEAQSSGEASNTLTEETPFPFHVSMRMGAAPWASRHRLLHIGIQGEKLAAPDRPPSNLVFLLDVSGSMRSPKKLPLLKQSFATLLEQLGPKDRVSIVVYAGASGLVLPSTSGSEKETIRRSIERLQAGGSTAGASGLRLAYDVAQNSFIDGGNNRVILATDGDFNVGVSSDAEMTRLIEKKRSTGVFLTTLGFGRGNLKDSKMEALAGHGNGNYYYIDSELEAKKVLSEEVGSTLHTIAKDVKLQIEFNPAHVQGYRLIGYVNRRLEDHEFADDSTDAGELGAGHSVTALYEIVPTGVDPHVDILRPDSLKYQSSQKGSSQGEVSSEWLTVNLRSKRPQSSTSQKMSVLFIPSRSASTSGKAGISERDFTFAAGVAGFGMILRDSPYKGSITPEQVLRLARPGAPSTPLASTDPSRTGPRSPGTESPGSVSGHSSQYREGFIDLVRAYQSITAGKEASDSSSGSSSPQQSSSSN